MEESNKIQTKMYEQIRKEFEASIMKEFGPHSNSKCFTKEKRDDFIEKLLAAADSTKELPKQIRGFLLGDSQNAWEQHEWRFKANLVDRIHLWTKKTFSSSAKNLGIIRRIVVLEEFFDLIRSLHERPTKDGYNGQKKLFNMIKNRYACLPRDAVDKYITLWRKATSLQQAPLQSPSSTNLNSNDKLKNESSLINGLMPTTSSFPLINNNNGLPSLSASTTEALLAAAIAVASANNNNPHNKHNAANFLANINNSSLLNSNKTIDTTSNTLFNGSSFPTISDNNSKATICHYSSSSQKEKNSNGDKFAGISMVYQPTNTFLQSTIMPSTSSFVPINNSSPISSVAVQNNNESSSINDYSTHQNVFIHPENSSLSKNMEAGSNYDPDKDSGSLKENNYEDGVPFKKLKLEEGDSDTNTENEDENVSPNLNTDLNLVKINGIKKLTDIDMAYNLFVRRIVDSTLDRTVTFCEQPKQIITALEAVCADAFPSLEKTRHRIKIRGYLKACRRNSKKHNGKVSMKDTPSHMCSERAYLMANEAFSRIEKDIERIKRELDHINSSSLYSSSGLLDPLPGSTSNTSPDAGILAAVAAAAVASTWLPAPPTLSNTSNDQIKNEEEQQQVNDSCWWSEPKPAHNQPTLPITLSAIIDNCTNIPNTKEILHKILHSSTLNPDLGLQILSNRSASLEAINCIRLISRFMLSRSLLVESLLAQQGTNQSTSYDTEQSQFAVNENDGIDCTPSSPLTKRAETNSTLPIVSMDTTVSRDMTVFSDTETVMAVNMENPSLNIDMEAPPNISMETDIPDIQVEDTSKQLVATDMSMTPRITSWRSLAVATKEQTETIDTTSITVAPTAPSGTINSMKSSNVTMAPPSTFSGSVGNLESSSPLVAPPFMSSVTMDTVISSNCSSIKKEMVETLYTPPPYNAMDTTNSQS